MLSIDSPFHVYTNHMMKVGKYVSVNIDMHVQVALRHISTHRSTDRHERMSILYVYKLVQVTEPNNVTDSRIPHSLQSHNISLGKVLTPLVHFLCKRMRCLQAE